jgi:hypothetical protein
MINRFWNRLFRKPVVWQRSIVELAGLNDLARTGLAGLLLAQEKARLDFVRVREAYERDASRANQERMQDSLMHLQATNAVVQSLLNERALEERLAAESLPEEIAVGKSR